MATKPKCDSELCPFTVRNGAGTTGRAQLVEEEKVVLSEPGPSQRTNTVWLHFYEVPGVLKPVERQEVEGGPRGWGGGMWSWWQWGQSFSLQKFWRWTVVGVA